MEWASSRPSEQEAGFARWALGEDALPTALHLSSTRGQPCPGLPSVASSCGFGFAGSGGVSHPLTAGKNQLIISPGDQGQRPVDVCSWPGLSLLVLWDNS